MAHALKSLAMAATAALALSVTANAGTLAYEGFGYPAGTTLNGAVAPAGFTGWKSDNTALPGYGIVSGLSYGTLNTSGNSLSGGYQFTVSGMKMQFSNPGWDSTETSLWAPYTKQVLNQYGGQDKMIGKDNTTLYVSWLMANSGVPSWAGGASLGLNVDNNNAGDPMATNMTGVGVSLGTTGAVTLQTVSYTGTYDVNPRNAQTASASGTTGVNLFVMKIAFGASGDTVSLYVNPALTTEPAIPSASITTTGDLVFRSLNLYGGADVNQTSFDEIRFASDWAGAVPVPEPAAIGTLALSAVALLRRRKA